MFTEEAVSTVSHSMLDLYVTESGDLTPTPLANHAGSGGDVLDAVSTLPHGYCSALWIILSWQYDLYAYDTSLGVVTDSEGSTRTVHDQPNVHAEQHPSVPLRQRRSFSCPYDPCQKTYTTNFRLNSLSHLPRMFSMSMPADATPSSSHQ